VDISPMRSLVYALTLCACYRSHGPLDGHTIRPRDARVVALDAPVVLDAPLIADVGLDAQPLACSDGWSIETVTTGRPLNAHLAIDGSGTLHVMYVVPYARVVYAWQAPGAAWHSETVVEADDLASAASTISVEPNGVVHACYDRDGSAAHSDDTDAWYAERSLAGEWRLERAATGVSGCQIALDSAKAPHLFFSSFSWAPFGTGAQHAARGADGRWSVESLEFFEVTPGHSGRGASISPAGDATGRMHAAYPTIEVRPGLRYAHRPADGAWQIEELAGSEHPSYRVAMVVGDDGRIHLAYYAGELYEDPVVAELYYAVRAGDGTWTSSLVDSDIGRGGATSIALGAGGEVHISYSSEGDVRHAVSDGGPWSLETIDVIPSIWVETSLISTPGALHIVYSHDFAGDGTGSSGELKHALRCLH
jgi:hypothetical protein